MPIDQRRRDEIAAAIEAHNRQDRERLLLPPDAVRLLAVMFPTDTVYRRSVTSLVAEGFDKRTLVRLLESLVDTRVPLLRRKVRPETS